MDSGLDRESDNGFDNGLDSGPDSASNNETDDSAYIILDWNEDEGSDMHEVDKNIELDRDEIE